MSVPNVTWSLPIIVDGASRHLLYRIVKTVKHFSLDQMFRTDQHYHPVFLMINHQAAAV